MSTKINYKKDTRAHNVAAVWYTKKEFGKHFFDYLGSIMFNSISLNVKKCIYKNVNKTQGYLYSI